MDRYQEIRSGEIDLAAGTQQIVFRSAGPIKGNLLQLGGVLLKPVRRGEVDMMNAYGTKTRRPRGDWRGFRA